MAGKSFKVAMQKTFKSTVNIPRVGAEPLPVSFTFKILERRALAKLFDSWKAQNVELLDESNAALDAGNPFTLEQWTDKEIDLQKKQLKDIVEGWGFSDEFSDENIEALIETSVSVTDVIISEYNDAYTRARQGN